MHILTYKDIYETNCKISNENIHKKYTPNLVLVYINENSLIFQELISSLYISMYLVLHRKYTGISYIIHSKFHSLTSPIYILLHGMTRKRIISLTAAVGRWYEHWPHKRKVFESQPRQIEVVKTGSHSSTAKRSL